MRIHKTLMSITAEWFNAGRITRMIVLSLTHMFFPR
jgi:hypothetical protein